jgi:hypothetical protein
VLMRRPATIVAWLIAMPSWLDGHQPLDLTAEKLLEHSRLPLAWHDQRTVLGFV